MSNHETANGCSGRINEESMHLHCHGSNMSVVSIAPTPAGERVALYVDWKNNRFIELPVVGFGIVRETTDGAGGQPVWLNDRQAAHPMVMDPSTGTVFPFAEHHRVGELVNQVGIFLTSDREGIEAAKDEKASQYGLGWLNQARI
ncbi:hypothetical protein ACFXKK_06215 [Streptomyces globisporus]|uniref:hypothetical protein n=1 Tax=Streptomyces globisporus TaxID=1908 RepID=UPI003654A803